VAAKLKEKGDEIIHEDCPRVYGVELGKLILQSYTVVLLMYMYRVEPVPARNATAENTCSTEQMIIMEL